MGGSDILGAANLIFNMVIFVIPGLIMAGMGSAIKKKKAPVVNLKKCPKCAEQVRSEAKVCRFCKYEFIEQQESPEKNAQDPPQLTKNDIENLWAQHESILKKKWG